MTRMAISGLNVPASHTLIVMSNDPDTILVPSGENAIELMLPLWALALSIFSSSVAAWEGRNGQIPQKKARIKWGPKHT